MPLIHHSSTFHPLNMQWPLSIVWSEICGGPAQEGATHEDHVAASRAFMSCARLFSSQDTAAQEKSNQSIGQSINRWIDKKNKQTKKQTNKQRKKERKTERKTETCSLFPSVNVARIMQNVQVADVTDASALAAFKDAEVSFSASVLLPSSQQT